MRDWKYITFKNKDRTFKILADKNGSFFLPSHQRYKKVKRLKCGDILQGGFQVQNLLDCNEIPLKDPDKSKIYVVPSIESFVEELDRSKDSYWNPSESLLRKYLILEMRKEFIGVGIKNIFNDFLYVPGALLKKDCYSVKYEKELDLRTIQDLKELFGGF